MKTSDDPLRPKLSRRRLNNPPSGKVVARAVVSQLYRPSTPLYTPREFDQRSVVKFYYRNHTATHPDGGLFPHFGYVARPEAGLSDSESPPVFTARDDDVDPRKHAQQWVNDARHFRIIFAPQNTHGLDLKAATRDLMERLEKDLKTRLDYVAVVHHDTAHPHVHIIIRGVADNGQTLFVPRDYVRHGLREAAQRVVTQHLGPRSGRDIAAELEQQIDAERFTNLDKTLLRSADTAGRIATAQLNQHRMGSLLNRRLQHLVKQGLVTGPTRRTFLLSADLEERLKSLGERGDIVRNQARLRRHGFAVGKLALFRNGTGKLLTGRVVDVGSHDSKNALHYVVVQERKGPQHYVVTNAKRAESLGVNSIVSVKAARAANALAHISEIGVEKALSLGQDLDRGL